ncbi:hypothetical protein GOAMI_09_00230 [Gordonia amicalis NBRC 100051 = JCM 11271]|nr:hypothetical protein GOAMI_09_00230 [Gordonia amicalis NBRC 100051 = JCM 11271]
MVVALPAPAYDLRATLARLRDGGASVSVLLTSPERSVAPAQAGAREPGANPGLARSGMGDGPDIKPLGQPGKASGSDEPESEYLPFSSSPPGISRTDAQTEGSTTRAPSS